jgi:hypothetical protein
MTKEYYVARAQYNEAFDKWNYASQALNRALKHNEEVERAEIHYTIALQAKKRAEWALQKALKETEATAV